MPPRDVLELKNSAAELAATVTTVYIACWMKPYWIPPTAVIAANSNTIKWTNRIQSVINGVITACQYDSNDRLLKQGGTICTYDDNGSTLTETLGGNVTRYEYNTKNELVKLTKAGAVTTYQYDIDGVLLYHSTKQTIAFPIQQLNLISLVITEDK